MTLFNPRHIRDAFSRAAPTYEANAHLQRDIARQCVLTLQSCISTPCPIVLDAGAGSGHVASETTAHGLNWNLLALEIAGPMCRLAARHTQQVIRGDMVRLPIAPESLDAIISSLALQWIAEPDNVLRQFAHATRPGGWAVLATFGPETLNELATTFASIDGNPRVTPFPSAAKLVHLADLAGWTLVAANNSVRHTQHANLFDLMRSLKAIGATDHRTNRRPGLTTPSLFQEAAARYPRNPDHPSQGIAATWQILTFTLRKPG